MTSYIIRGIDAELWQAVKRRASADGRSLRWLILRLLALYAANGLENLERFAPFPPAGNERPDRSATLTAGERSIG